MSTELGALIGTPAYMSPEQIRGADVDTQTDIWSLGVVLYEMLAGQMPFRGSTKIDQIAAVLLSEPSPVRIDNFADLDKINVVLLKALCKEKMGRYREVRELLTDLQTIKNATETRSDARLKRKIFSRRSAWKYAAGMALIATLLIAGLPASRELIVSRLLPQNPTTASVQLPITSGLVSYWPADGNPNDAVGGNDGELLNGATYRPGVSGQAFSFDGDDDLFQAPTNGWPTGPSDRTMAMWIKVDEFTKLEFYDEPEEFFGGYGQFGAFGQAYSLGGFGQFGAFGQAHSIGGAGNSVFFTNWGKALDGGSLETGRWYHVAIVTNSNSTSIYVDSVLKKNLDMTIDTPTDTKFYSGRIPGERGDTRRLKGAVDEIVIFDRALSAAEIQNLYLSNKPPDT